jgi:aryl-alcohol dehydrogenase-like predicted oxidoreductase
MVPPALPSFSPRRELGRTGFTVTAIGIGDLADRSVPLDECVATVRRAMDAGLNFIDTAPGYENGYSEEIVGAAVAPRRDDVFVVDKIDHLDRPVAEQVDESLARMELDHADAFVFHGASSAEAWERIASPGGRMDELEACVRAGKAKFRGISSHSPDVLRVAVESARCDIVLFAIGAFCDVRFVDEILPLARERGVGTVGMKTFGSGKLLGDTEGYGRPLKVRPRGKLSSGGEAVTGAPVLPRLSVEECVRYSLTCDPDVALLGLSFPNEQDEAFAAAAAFTPMSSEEMAACRERAAEAVKGKGPCWWNPQC